MIKTAVMRVLSSFHFENTKDTIYRLGLKRNSDAYRASYGKFERYSFALIYKGKPLSSFFFFLLSFFFLRK